MEKKPEIQSHPLGESKSAGKTDENLAGGHVEAFKFLPDGSLLKKGKKAELEFYRDFQRPDSKYYSELQILKPYLPHFFDVIELEGKTWIKMQNLCYNLTNVSFLDIKMGDKTYSPDDPPEKMANQTQRAKNTTSFEYGFRVTGMTVRDEKGVIAFKMQKEFINITIDKIPELFRRLLTCNGWTKVNVDAAKFYVHKLKEILELFETKLTRLMIASSVFFVLSNTDNKYDLKLIDFAHVFPLKEGERDEGYIKGLKNVIKILEGIIEEAMK